MITLLDNTVLSNFALVGRTDLLSLALGRTGASVDEVIQEYELGVHLGRVPSVDWSWLLRLSLGEAACLALAHERGYRVLTDDRVARDIAARLRVPVSGTLGVLALLADQGRVTVPEADEVLRRMIDKGYRSPITSIGAIV